MKKKTNQMTIHIAFGPIFGKPLGRQRQKIGKETCLRLAKNEIASL